MADQQSAGMIEVQGRHSRPTDGRLYNEQITLPPKVFKPLICPGIEEWDDGSGVGVWDFRPV
jgi:hypothetical protein